MLDDEEKAGNAPIFAIGQNLDAMSVDELRETTQSLKQEIQRLEQAIREKSAHMDAASALFKR